MSIFEELIKDMERSRQKRRLKAALRRSPKPARVRLPDEDSLGAAPAQEAAGGQGGRGAEPPTPGHHSGRRPDLAKHRG